MRKITIGDRLPPSFKGAGPQVRNFVLHVHLPHPRLQHLGEVLPTHEGQSQMRTYLFGFLGSSFR